MTWDFCHGASRTSARSSHFDNSAEDNLSVFLYSHLKKHPMTYALKIPELDAELEITCAVKDQELFFPERADLNHYEGAASVKGTYLGKPVSGYTYVELVGDWGEK